MADDNKQAAKNAARVAEAKKNLKKKKWCPILASEMFNSRPIGESLLEDASQLMHRTVTVNLMQLTGDMKKQHVSIMFKVTDIKEGKGCTRAVKLELAPASIKRLSKRDRDKIADSFVVKTADNLFVRVKPLMITNSLTKGSVTAALVNYCRALCKEMINKLSFDALMSDVIGYKFQREIREKLNKVYPLKSFEIRAVMIETKRKKETVEEFNAPTKIVEEIIEENTEEQSVEQQSDEQTE